MTAEWAWKTRGSIEEYEKYRQRNLGCDSFTKMAIRCFLVHCPNLTASSLEGLPWVYGKLLWDHIIKAQLDSIKVWQAFASVYPKTIRRTVKYIPEQRLPLYLYTEPLLSPSLHWLSILTLENITVLRSTLIQTLSRLTNLGVLTFGEGLACDPGVGIDDNVMRAIGRHAAESDDGQAFGILRVLNLRMQPSITSRVLGYLRPLPMLAVINVHRCGIPYHDVRTAEKVGWKYHRANDTPSAIVEVADEPGIPSWDSVAHASLSLAKTLEEKTVTKDAADAIDGLPRLHLKLGQSSHSFPLHQDWPPGRGMLTLVRNPGYCPETDDQHERSNKRHRSGSDPPAEEPKKKSKLRPSRQPEMCDLLRNFAS